LLEQRLRRSEHEVAKMDLQLASEVAIEMSEVNRKMEVLPWFARLGRTRDWLVAICLFRLRWLDKAIVST
jgi:hypothetical protein